MPLLPEVIAALERRYPPATAASWDAVGLVCGDPRDAVRRAHFAVDPVRATVDEAVELGADLLVTHHPLLLTPVHGVPAGDPKGGLVHRLIRAGVALYVAHTNADAADPGVSDALARAVGLTDLVPLRADPGPELDLLVTYVPVADADRVLAALGAAGAGALGDYRDCAWTVEGIGRFTPQPGARPAIGAVGAPERVAELRVEAVVPVEKRSAVRAALLAAHPYEEVAYSFLPTRATPSGRGTGRIGMLPETVTLADFTARVAAALPATSVGVRAAGDPQRPVRRVAVCGGAGDSLLAAAAAAGVDVYLTGDLRHHRSSEHLEAGGPALIDPGHWASEWPWLGQAARLLTDDTNGAVEVSVSDVVTDPWTLHHANPAGGGASAPG